MPARKGRSKKVYPPNKHDWQTGNNGREGSWGTQQLFCLSLHSQSIFLHLSSGWNSRKGLGEQNTSHCKRRSGSWPPEEPEYTLSLWDLMSCIPESWANWLVSLPSCSPWYLNSHGSQVKSLVTGRRETFHPFLKRVERRTLGTTDLSASPLCLGRSWNRFSWKLC